MDYRSELERRVHDWWEITQHTRAGFANYAEPRISAKVTDADARLFLAGLDATPPLYWIVDGYILNSPMLPRVSSGGMKQFNLFENKRTYAGLRDETFAHYGAASELVLELGWPLEQVISEPRAAEVLSRGSLDLLALDPRGMVRLAVEAKGDARKLRSLVTGMNRCEGVVSPPHSRTDHKKCEGLLHFRPEALWAVATGPTRELYRVEYSEGWVRLHLQESAVPRPPA